MTNTNEVQDVAPPCPSAEAPAEQSHEVEAAAGVAPAAASRRRGLDALRGLAVALMFLDHALLIAGTGLPLRLTLGRLALPIFFVVAGACLSRFTRRHVLIGFVGFVLPVLVPWVDDPNVLLWYAFGAFVLSVASRTAAVLVVVVALTCLANGYAPWAAGGTFNTYEPLALLALMAVGRLLGRDSFAWSDRIAVRPLPWLGRHALVLYVAHLLILEGLVYAL